MENVDLIRNIGIMIVAAMVMVLIGRRLYVPNIVLYIIAGLLLGPVFGLLESSHELVEAAADHAGQASNSKSESLHLISEFGIALLLFLVGLELSLDRIKDIGKVAVLAGVGQVIFTAFFGFLLSMLLGFSVMESVFLATALTFSSTVVVVKLLDQKKEINSLYGRIAVGIFLVQDLVVIIVLTILAGIGAPDQMTFGNVALGLLRAFAGAAALLAGAILAAKFVLTRPMAWASRSAETLLIWALFWCFLFVSAAEWMGLSREIGAFLAGMSLAQLWGSHDLRRRLHPLMNFFIAIFFISLGANMQLGDAAQHWFACVVLALFVLLGNPFIFMWIIAKSGYGERTSFFTSVTVAQISEFSFIFVAVGLAAGLIDRSIVSVTTVVGLITIAVSAYMILYNRPLYAWVRRLGLLRMFRAKQVDDDVPPTEMSNHIVIVGMNALGRAIAKRLHEHGETVLAVDSDPHKLLDLPCAVLIGNIDYLDVVEESGLARAKFAVSALQIEDTNNLFAWRCRELGVPAAIHAFDRSVVDELGRLEVAFQIDSKASGNVLLATAMSRRGVFES